MADDAARDGLRRLRHDLRTPLTVVVGFSEILASDRDITDEQRHQYAQRVLDAALEMRTLLDAAD